RRADTVDDGVDGDDGLRFEGAGVDGADAPLAALVGGRCARSSAGPQSGAARKWGHGQCRPAVVAQRRKLRIDTNDVVATRRGPADVATVILPDDRVPQVCRAAADR